MIALGPTLPVAFCGSYGTRHKPLTLERHEYLRDWECWCPDCVDGEPDGETGRMVALYPIGSGDTPWEALDNYAQHHYAVDPEELLVDGKGNQP